MAENRANLAFGAPDCEFGAVWRKELDGLGASLPTDATTALDAPPWIPQGAVSEEGLSRSITKTRDEIRGWCGNVLARPRTELGVTLTFQLIEADSADVAKSIWGDQVTVIPATVEHGVQLVLAFTGEDPEPSAWCFNLKSGRKRRRIVVPFAELTTDSLEQTFTRNSLIAYPVTLTLYPDEAGVYFYEYTDNGVLVNGEPGGPEEDARAAAKARLLAKLPYRADAGQDAARKVAVTAGGQEAALPASKADSGPVAAAEGILAVGTVAARKRPAKPKPVPVAESGAVV